MSDSTIINLSFFWSCEFLQVTRDGVSRKISRIFPGYCTCTVHGQKVTQKRGTNLGQIMHVTLNYFKTKIIIHNMPYSFVSFQVRLTLIISISIVHKSKPFLINLNTI